MAETQRPAASHPATSILRVAGAALVIAGVAAGGSFVLLWLFGVVRGDHWFAHFSLLMALCFALVVCVGAIAFKAGDRMGRQRATS